MLAVNGTGWLSHLHRRLGCSLCCIGLQLREHLAHALPTPEACCRGEAVAVLAVGVHCCEVVELCPVQGAQVLVVALGHTPLACTCGVQMSPRSPSGVYYWKFQEALAANSTPEGCSQGRQCVLHANTGAE